MGQSSRGVTVIHTPFIVAVFVCMLTFSFIAAPRTQALSLDPVLNTVTVVTKTVSGDDKEVKSSRSSSSQPQNSQRSGASTGTPVSPSPSSTSEAVVPASEEVIVAEPLQELPTIEEGAVVTPPVTPIRQIKAVSASVGGVGVQSGITPLQATEQGWKLFGIAWYWLGIIGATLWGGFIYMQRYYLNLSRSRLLPLLLRAGASQGEA
jgi:hypothetical protein